MYLYLFLSIFKIVSSLSFPRVKNVFRFGGIKIPILIETGKKMIENWANKTRDPRGKKQPSSLSLNLDKIVVWLRFTDTWMQPIIVSIAHQDLRHYINLRFALSQPEACGCWLKAFACYQMAYILWFIIEISSWVMLLSVRACVRTFICLSLCIAIDRF